MFIESNKVSLDLLILTDSNCDEPDIEMSNSHFNFKKHSEGNHQENDKTVMATYGMYIGKK